MTDSLNSDFDSPFGTYALGAIRDFIRKFGAVMPANKFGLLGASGVRRLALFGIANGLDGPYDVQVAPHINARLFPRSNRCEKRAFCGVQTWDQPERSFIVDALKAKQADAFTFVDVGANVGLYSLFVHSAATDMKRDCTIVAIEPDPENRNRLVFNATASGADINVEAVAVSGAAGEGILAGGDRNRGSIGLQSDTTVNGVKVPLEPLYEILKRNKLKYVDAMKVDIEGHDYVALEAFFNSAPKTLFPTKLIVETGQYGKGPIVDLALANGYRLADTTKMNAMLERRDDE